MREWARRHFALFAEEGFESPTITCVKNTREESIAELNAELGRQYAMISNGYGVLKEKTFRIAHMGWINEPMVLGAVGCVEATLRELSIDHGAGGIQAAVASLSDEP